MGSLFSKGSPSPPPAPDPTAVAGAQAQYNKQSAIDQAALNRIKETTPFGTLSYNITGENDEGIPIYERTTTLSPEQQQLYDLATNLQQTYGQVGQSQLDQLTSTLGEPINFDGLPAQPNVPTGPQFPDLPTLDGLPDAPIANDETRQRVEQAMYDRATSRLDPMYEDRQRQLETQLVNQGFDRSSEAYRNELEDFRRDRGDSYRQALNEAIMAGGAEQSRLFGLESQARSQALGERQSQYGLGMDQAMQQFNADAQLYGLGANARERAMQEQLTLRNQPLNELAAIGGQSAGVTLPQFTPVAQAGIQAPNYLGAAAMQQQQQNANYQNQVSQQQNLYGNLFGLAGTALGGWAYGGF